MVHTLYSIHRNALRSKCPHGLRRGALTLLAQVKKAAWRQVSRPTERCLLEVQKKHHAKWSPPLEALAYLTLDLAQIKHTPALEASRLLMMA